MATSNFFSHSICSVCISALILSSEALNSESTASDSQENVLQRPNIASESVVISDQLSDSHTVTDRTNLNSDEISTSDNSEQDIKIDTFIPKTETQLPQPNGLESIQQNVVTPDQETSAEKITGENV